MRIKPQLVIVDELAHTNVPGSRHPKRWQDITEILDNGIDVYSTLNVQHIESLKDIVESITGIKIRETVPDSIIESATYIELVDITPDELLQRLKEGKVYLGDKPEIAAKNFFQQDRLTALREIILRYAAEKVDHELHGLISTVERPERWSARERLLVAIDETKHSQKLIRTTRRLASRLSAPWLAVHVNDGRLLSEEENSLLSKNLSLARDLGAEVITTNDPSIADGVKRIARQRGVTQIILGRPPISPFFRIFRRESLLDRLAKECSDIDIHVVGQEELLTKYRKRLIAFSYKREFFFYFLVMCSVLLLTAINAVLNQYTGYKVVGVIFLMYILFLSLFFRKGPIFFASILFAIIWNFLFVPPIGAMHIGTNEDIALLILYVFTAIATGILVDRTREHQIMLAKREESAQALFDIARQIVSASHNHEAIKSVKERLVRLFPGSFEILPKNADDTIDLRNPMLSDDKEKSAAIWVFENGKEAGWSTDTLPSSENLYIPLKEFAETVGILIFHPKSMNKFLTLEEKNFLYTVCSQLGNYLERKLAEEKAHKAEQVQQIKKVHTSILNKISLVFHQPLVISQDAIKTLKNQRDVSSNKVILSEIRKIENSLEQLIEILANISAMVKLSEGMATLHKSSHHIKELIKACCDNLKKATVNHILIVNITENLPQIHVDFSLIEILLLNLITNAIYYSPLNSTIIIEAMESNGYIVISISDEGKEIPEDQLDAVFEKFYRLPDAESRGIGIGLSAAKTIAEMHGGYLKAENRPQKGAKFSLFLPIP